MDEPRVTLAGENGYLLNSGSEAPLNRLQLAAFSGRHDAKILRKFTGEAPAFLRRVASIPEQFIAID